MSRFRVGNKVTARSNSKYAALSTIGIYSRTTSQP
jgi:hypothetical protein